MEEQILGLLPARRGHFLLESGHHGNLWLDLDSLFLRPAALLPVARELARRIGGHGVEAVVGPLVGGAFVAQMVAAELDACFALAERRVDVQGVTYAIPDAFHDHLRGRSVAIVDDAINAGSATRARLLVERPADQLQAERQALRVEAGRHRDARQARHVHRHGEDVVEIHLDRIGAALLADAERRRRRRRRQDRVDPWRSSPRNRA
jgi:nucleotide-binding universal stress UspA family protein